MNAQESDATELNQVVGGNSETNGRKMQYEEVNKMSEQRELLSDEELDQVTGGTQSLSQLYDQMRAEKSAEIPKRYREIVEEIKKLQKSTDPEDQAKLLRDFQYIQDMISSGVRM